MKKTPELLVGIVIIALILAGVFAYFVGAPSVIAPTVPAIHTQSTTTPVTSNDTTTYTDPNHVFSFSYPSIFTLSGGTMGYTQEWMNNATTTGLALVKVVVPQSFELNTNFSDARFTVGTSSHPDAVRSCLAAPASGSPIQKTQVSIHGVVYTKYTTMDAAAGNRYETTSYRTVHAGQCYAIEYTIHYGNIQNYPTDSGITEFNKTKVQNALETIVQSFSFSS